MKLKIIIVAILLILGASFVVGSPLIYELRDGVNYKIVCIGDDGAYCSESTQLLVTLTAPNGTLVHENISATYNGTTYNFTLGTSDLGEYSILIISPGSNTSSEILYKVTQTGREFTSGQGTVSLGILASVLTLAFIFIIIGNKLSSNEKLIPLAFFFFIFALLLGIYSLQLGFAFSNDILEYEHLTGTQTVVYHAILWSLIGLSIISASLMLVAFIMELGKMGKTKQFGADFDPITNTYQ